MKTKSSIPSFLLFDLFVLASLSVSYENSFDDNEFSVVYTYSRFAEIEKRCSPFLSLASELSPDDNTGYRLKKELSFSFGDWQQQENGRSPLMPFDQSDKSDSPWHRTPHTAHLKLASFQVKDINPVHHFENSVSLGGIMSIGMSRNTSRFDCSKSSTFYIRPGLSILSVVFEGIYLETEGERLMCLLGNTTLPILNPGDDYWDLANGNLPDYSLVQDDQILLVLRYPQNFNLTRRAIKGEMRSLNEYGSLKYFDDVHISSQLSRHSKYQFSSELKSSVCDQYTYQEELSEDGAIRFDGSEFCIFLQQVSQEPFSVFPNYKFSEKDARYNKFGPFKPEMDINSAQFWRWNYEDVKLVLHNLVCKVEYANDTISNARISAVLRAFHSSVRVETARERTGLSGLTLSAEGSWNSLSGQLCMIGCLGVVDSGLEGCKAQICLYFPRVLSIKQRSIILGSISSINRTDQFFPLLFNSVRQTVDLRRDFGLDTFSYLPYNYSKIELATAIRNRNQPSKVFTLFKQLFFKYPALEDGQDALAQLVHLCSILNFNSYAFRHQSSKRHHERIFVRMDVVSFGSSLGLYDKDLEKTSATEKLSSTQLLNISLHLMQTEGPPTSRENYIDFSPLFLEGVYDPMAGSMHLIGCRMVSDGRIIVDRGLDCLVETKVQYPSESLKWLKNPSVEISITSQRNEDDPLYFNSMTLQTCMISYDNHANDVAFRKLFEGVLRILFSLVTVGIIISQLHYMNKNSEFIPYISLAMLAEQILGYGAELIRATEILIESKESESYRMDAYPLLEYQFLLKILEFPTRFLILAALILTAWIYLKVSEAKSKPNAYGPKKPKRIPHNEHVIQRNLKIHIGLCLIAVVLRVLELFLNNDLHLRDAFLLPAMLIRYVERDILWFQDVFLLPQVLENRLWQTQVKPLRKMYYIGLTLLRLVLHFYNYSRDPISDPYSDEVVFNHVGSDFFSIYGIKPLFMIVFAAAVHIQQSWNHLKSTSG